MAISGWSKEKEDDKVCFIGNKEKGSLIIKELERLGGVNSDKLLGRGISCYYYINKDKEITYDSFIPKGYTLKSIEDIVRTSEEPLLEVGKWYTCDTWDKNSYAKFLSFENVKDYQKFHFSECIRGGEFRVKNDWWSVRGDYSLIKEVSLEEIQPYLPEGHADKLPSQLTELPEKWCIRGYEKVAEYSNKYGQYPPYAENMELFHHYPCHKPGCTTSTEIKEGYVEITLEQFKKWILKEPLKDKKQFEIGKWYKITNSTATYFVKVTNLRHDSLGGKFIVGGEYCDSIGGFTLDDIKEQSLLTDLSEIQKYLPENHPDKMITKTIETDILEKPYAEKENDEKVKPKLVLLKPSKKVSISSKIERIHDKKSKV